MDEKALIARAVAGDPAAERSLYDAHVERIYRLVYRMTGCPDLAEECTQQAFVRAFERLAQFRGEAALSSWLHAIAVSVTINSLRQRRRRRGREVAWEEAEAGAMAVAAPQVDSARELHAAMDRLPDRQRWVLVMHTIEGYGHREIAEILGIPENTSKARLFYARRALRRALGLEPARNRRRTTLPGSRQQEIRHEG